MSCPRHRAGLPCSQYVLTHPKSALCLYSRPATRGCTSGEKRLLEASCWVRAARLLGPGEWALEARSGGQACDMGMWAKGAPGVGSIGWAFHSLNRVFGIAKVGNFD